MNSHICYRVCVDNYGAQIKRRDHVNTHLTREDAVKEIVEAFHDRIDDDIMAGGACDDADGNLDEAKYSAAWKEVEKEISERGYEDGDGHRYYVREEDDRAPLYVAVIRSFYGPRETLKLLEVEYYGYTREFKTLTDALQAVDELNGARYDLANNEAGRPEYVIIDEETKDWIEDDDIDKYDYPDGDDRYDVNSDAYDNEALNDLIEKQRIAYIREHAISKEG